MSRKTVESHLSRMFLRYDVVTRTDLAVRAEREGWLDLPSRAG
jgi:DNA-binding CsgD family transcriptional regulator